MRWRDFFLACLSLIYDNKSMKTYTLKQTVEFKKWAKKLDAQTRARIYFRADTACVTGNFGDHHGVGGGVNEMRFHFAHGFRVYYTIWRDQVVLLLLGGDKSGQSADIAQARKMLPKVLAQLEQEEKNGK